MAKKAEVTVTFRVRDAVDVSVRRLVNATRLGSAQTEAVWAYEIKVGNGVVFKGANLYTDLSATHGEAARDLIGYHMPSAKDGGVAAWFDKEGATMRQLRWFLADFRDVSHIANGEYFSITDYADVFLVNADGSTVPFDAMGRPVDSSTLGSLAEGTRYLAENTKTLEA